MKYLYLDTETCGLPPKNSHWENDYELFPNVLSIAWKYKEKENYYLIYQDGNKVPKEATAIHGITTKMANDKKKTVSFVFAIDLLLKDAYKADKIVGHNIYFDISMIKADILKRKLTCIPEFIEAFDKSKRIDTMRMCTRLFGKWPKLTELHEHLFNSTFNAHNSLDDVRATERCHQKL